MSLGSFLMEGFLRNTLKEITTEYIVTWKHLISISSATIVSVTRAEER